jgi:diphthamide biosynthesis protein 4
MPVSRKREPTLFDILSLSPTALDGQDGPAATKVVRQAYRRALLKHHPDKSQQAAAAAQLQQEEQENGNKSDGKPSPSSSSSTSPTSTSQQTKTPGPTSKPGAVSKAKTEQHYTVDEITHAYTVLSDARQRREYVRALRTGHSCNGSTWVQSGTTTTTSSSSSPGQTWNYTQTFHFSSSSSPPNNNNNSNHQHNSGAGGGPRRGAEVETVDLDDLTWDGRAGTYHRSCHRCGAARGYALTEDDLDAAAGGDDGTGGGEVLVQCTGCSLWLRVLFAEVMDDDDEEEEEQEEEGQQHSGGRDPVRAAPSSSPVSTRSNGSAGQVGANGIKVSGGSVSGKTANWSFKLNFGISIGGGVSASAGAQSGAR